MSPDGNFKVIKTDLALWRRIDTKKRSKASFSVSTMSLVFDVAL